MSKPDRHARQRGIILVVVLWTVASLSLLLSAFNVSVRTNNAVARVELVAAKLESLADAGVELAVARLYARGKDRWRPDGRAYTVRFGNATLRVRITDANGLVDLNKASDDVLFAVFKARLGSDQVAGSLRDWVVAQRTKTQEAGAARANRPAAFIAVDDLLKKPGMTVQQLNRLRDLLTVHNRHGKVNPLTAPAQLLPLLPGLGPREVAAILRARNFEETKFSIASLSSKPARDALKTGEGPAYRIVVDVSGAGFAKSVTMTAMILMRADGDAPYYGLSWEPFGF